VVVSAGLRSVRDAVIVRGLLAAGTLATLTTVVGAGKKWW
jgi:hypothetical protein